MVGVLFVFLENHEKMGTLKKDPTSVSNVCLIACVAFTLQATVEFHREMSL